LYEVADDLTGTSCAWINSATHRAFPVERFGCAVNPAEA
jgi:hypothetical protein